MPPVEGFDFTPWINEMGLEALPYQTTVFPIQMNGWSYDYMLAMDDTNCPARGNQRATLKDALDKSAKDIAAAQYPAMQTYFDKYGWREFCDYVTWAYIESVELKLDPPLEEDKRFSTCQAIQLNQTKQYFALEDNATLKHVSTKELRQNLQEQIDSWLAASNATSSHSTLSETDRKPKKSLEGTAGSESPRYVMMWTSEEKLSLMA